MRQSGPETASACTRGICVEGRAEGHVQTARALPRSRRHAQPAGKFLAAFRRGAQRELLQDVGRRAPMGSGIPVKTPSAGRTGGGGAAALTSAPLPGRGKYSPLGEGSLTIPAPLVAARGVSNSPPLVAARGVRMPRRQHASPGPKLFANDHCPKPKQGGRIAAWERQGRGDGKYRQGNQHASRLTPASLQRGMGNLCESCQQNRRRAIATAPAAYPVHRPAAARPRKRPRRPSSAATADRK